MEYNELINGFAEKFAIAGLKIDNGATALEIDGIDIEIVHDTVLNEVIVIAEIGMPPPDANGPFGSAMLKANYMFSGTDRAVLCQNPETNAYALMKSWPLISLDVETFANAMGALMNTTEQWRELVSGARAAEEAAPHKGAAPRESPHGAGDFSLGGFMQV